MVLNIMDHLLLPLHLLLLANLDEFLLAFNMFWIILADFEELITQRRECII